MDAGNRSTVYIAQLDQCATNELSSVKSLINQIQVIWIFGMMLLNLACQ